MLLGEFGIRIVLGHGLYGRLAAYDLRADGKLKWHIGRGLSPTTNGRI